MLCLRSGEFKNSARAFSVRGCIHDLNCGKCDVTCMQILNLSFVKAVGVLGSFCPWLNCTASSRKRCCLAYPLSPQRVALDVMVRIPALIFIDPGGWCVRKHPAASLFITFLVAVPGCCQVLNQNGLLVWLIYGWFCIPRLCYSDSQMESHLPQNLHSHHLHPISSYMCEDTCFCSLGGLTLSLQEELLSCVSCISPA